jgi:3-hydroxybutyryl-CoA dehydrogenase
VEQMIAFVKAIEKTPLLVQDSPGLVVNRIAQAYYGEALDLLDESNVDFQTVDKLMEASGFPMGPFRLMDFIGVDTAYNLTRSLFEATFYAAPYRPHPRQHRLITAGRLGRGRSRGFYSDST